MKTSELDFDLPEALIAQHPLNRRTDSRLMVLPRYSDKPLHRHFSDLLEYLNPGDCLVLNDTKVIPARFHLRRATGGHVEGLFLNLTEKGHWHVLLKSASRVKQNETLTLSESQFALTVDQRQEEGHWILSPDFLESHLTILEKFGTMPLPPYIHRATDQTDERRYQTVYADTAGSVAAPTAGLHFSDDFIEAIQQKNIHVAKLTLHVGLGTFKPVTVENLNDHVIHEETYCLCPQAAEVVNQTIDRAHRVIAVGTTSVRTLETLAQNNHVVSCSGSTRLFITPGFNFQITKAIITNFHLPRSSLLALVSAFAGTEQILNAYREAITQNYRFSSYGDAMLLL
jgi:S-adenosylmethionine:tRNA ribosyltransferase-isomerase